MFQDWHGRYFSYLYLFLGSITHNFCKPEIGRFLLFFVIVYNLLSFYCILNPFVIFQTFHSLYRKSLPLFKYFIVTSNLVFELDYFYSAYAMFFLKWSIIPNFLLLKSLLAGYYLENYELSPQITKGFWVAELYSSTPWSNNDGK